MKRHRLIFLAKVLLSTDFSILKERKSFIFKNFHYPETVEFYFKSKRE